MKFSEFVHHDKPLHFWHFCYVQLSEYYSILLFNQLFKHPLICNLSIFIKFCTHYALKNCTSQFIVLWRTQLNCKSLIYESHSTVNSHLLLSVATHSEIQRLDRPNNPVGIDEYELKTKEIPNNQSYSKF